MKHPALLFHNGFVSRAKGMPRRLSQRGFTLIELMISLTLGLLLMTALVAVFLNVSRTNTEMVKTNGLIENGRFAIDILQEDIEHGGFWGGYTPQFDDFSSTLVPGDAPSLAPDPCLAFNAANWTAAYKNALLGIPVQSYDAIPTGCTALISSKKPSTDVLVVRHAANCLPDGANCEALDNSKLYFQSSFCEAETTAATPLRYVLSNTAADFTLKKRGCTGVAPTTAGTLSDKRKFISNIYYIRTHAVTAGDGIPTLMRSTFNLVSGVPAHEDPPAALIEGIEGLMVELGIDGQNRCGTATNYTTAISAVTRVRPSTCAVDAVTATNNTMPTNRGDGVPETPFVRCTTGAGCNNAQLRDVVNVKLYVLARSRETAPGYTDSKVYCLGSSCPTPTATTCPETAGVAANALPLLGPFCDGFKRHVFQSTVRLPNISGRRETP
ncbi:type IV pilus assembly protein PilW [Polaromonas sp. CG_9.5]|uniref:PilW family protein n=1 Tax=Polaromonas sp. CG_9.5 TaxID=3071705 RepID=UPI002E0BCA3B|nr:type IV pilus assembly protein PilW [Polaromonas sp. CG_9.5]